jgi:hypothetical protein
MKNCATCGMPLEKKEDFALGDEKARFCAYCVNPDGSVKSGEEIFNGGVQFFGLEVCEEVTAKPIVKNHEKNE